MNGTASITYATESAIVRLFTRLLPYYYSIFVRFSAVHEVQKRIPGSRDWRPRIPGSRDSEIPSGIECPIASHGIGFHKYADDTQLYISLQQPITLSLDSLARCTTDLQHWYWSNDLLLNPDKSEVAFFGIRQRMQRVNLPTSVNVAGSSVAVCDTLRTLSVKLDWTLTFDSHVNDIVR